MKIMIRLRYVAVFVIVPAYASESACLQESVYSAGVYIE